MAQAYHKPPPSESPEVKQGEELPDRLPGESKLGLYEIGKTLIAEIQHDVTALEESFNFTLATNHILAELIEPGVDGNATKSALITIHRELRRALATKDAAVCTGFDLGRMLADTVLLVDPKFPGTLNEEFKHERLGNAYGWLDDLHSLLPDYASDAVSGSLKQWEAWVKGNSGAVPKNISRGFTRALDHQGEMWRRLLCGEKLAIDLLSASDYRKAGNRVAKRFLGLTGSYIVSWWYVILLFAATIAGIVYVIVKYAPTGTSTIAALIATAAGSLGVSWKTVASTLGRVVSKAEGPLWETEVRAAIVIAATHTPRKKVTP